MNMISTGTFLNEMDASIKQETIAERFVSAWEKKNAKAARAGGVSLMALSLAACGGSSSTTTTTDTSTDTTPVTPAVDADKSIALTTATDTGASFTGGSGADKFTGIVDYGTSTTVSSASTYELNDEIAGGAGTDTVNILLQNGDVATSAAGSAQKISIATAEIASSNATKDSVVVSAKVGNVTYTGATVTEATNTSGITHEQIADAVDDLLDSIFLGDATVAHTDTTASSYSTVTVTGTTVGQTLDVEFVKQATTALSITPTTVSIAAVNGTLAAIPGATLSDIEIVEINNTTGQAVSGSASTWGGPEQIWNVSSAASNNVTVTAVAAGTTIGVKGKSNMDVTFKDSTAAAPITAGDVNVALSGAGTSSTDSDITLTAGANQTYTTVNVDAVAGTSYANINGDATSSATKMVITGAGKASVNLQAAMNTVDASGNSGGVTLAIGSETDTVLTGGTGNDKITASTADSIASTAKLAVDAGDGEDTLVIGDANDINSAADGARYSNFEVLSVSANQDVSLVSGITSIKVTADTASLSELTQAQANAITVSDAGGDDVQASLTVVLNNATGTSDSATITLADAAAGTNVGITELDVDNIETINFIASTGTNTTGESAIDFEAHKADEVKAINISGSADVKLTVDNTTLDVVAVTIDASGLTGTGDFTLAGGVLLSGSKVIGSANADTIALSSTTGTSYETGGGKDAITGSAADLASTGANDSSLDTGTEEDTLTLDDTDLTLVDSHFTNVSNLDKLVGSGVGDYNITAGAAFDAAFESTISVTTATLGAGKDITFAGGNLTKDTTITIDGTSLDLAGTAEDIIVTTGSGSDTVTFTGDSTATFHATTGATITVATNAGDDTINITVGTIADSADYQAIEINAGAGKDTVTMTKVNGGDTSHFGFAAITIGAGDSTIDNYDVYKGIDIGGSSDLSDKFDFAGTAAVTDFTASADAGTIMSHTVSNGFITFDDAATFGGAIKINASNLSDVITYLQTNTATNDVAAFSYDKDSDGTEESTMLFHNGSTDSLVLIDGVSAIDHLVTSATVTAGELFIA